MHWNGENAMPRDGDSVEMIPRDSDDQAAPIVRESIEGRSSRSHSSAACHGGAVQIFGSANVLTISVRLSESAYATFIAGMSSWPINPTRRLRILRQ